MNGPLLALDGALGPFSAALVTPAGSLLRSESTAGNDALERGLLVVETVLGGLPPGQLGGLAVGTGPGGFTGLRIALSYAKSLAFATGLPLAGVSSYDVLEGDAPADAPRATFVSGKSGFACVRFRAGAAAEPEITCADYETLAAALAGRLPAGAELWCAGALEGVASRLSERGIIVRASSPSVQPPALAVARAALRRGFAPSAHALRADYGQ